MGKPDALSHQSDHDMGKEDNNDVILLEPQLFINALRQQGHVNMGTGMEVVLMEMRRAELDEEGSGIFLGLRERRHTQPDILRSIHRLSSRRC